MVNNKKIAFLFPGQGAQYPGMAMDLMENHSRVRSLMEQASEAAGLDIPALLKEENPETLKRTDLSQPAITAANIAAAEVLLESGIVPSFCAGFSLGEYAALAVAKIITVEDCFRLVAARGKVMQKTVDRIALESGDGRQPGMAAVLGLSPEDVEELLRQWATEGLSGLYGANFNSPRQVVVSGTADALDQAELRFKEAGAKRIIRLKVAGPFHSPLMAQAAQAFKPVLDSITFTDPLIPVFSNVTGDRISSGSEARTLALRQICEPVRWTKLELALASLDPELALEPGPGKVLQGLWKEAVPEIPIYAAGTNNDIDILSGMISSK